MEVSLSHRQASNHVSGRQCGYARGRARLLLGCMSISDRRAQFGLEEEHRESTTADDDPGGSVSGLVCLVCTLRAI